MSARFVGRAVELDQLSAALDAALAGRGSLLAITGEAGIGKTRLTEQFAEVARAQGALLLWARPTQEEGAPAFEPWAQVLRGLARARTAGALAPWAGPLAPLLPELAGDTTPLSAAHVIGAAVACLVSAADDGPLMIVLDDLHTADGSSLRLAAAVAEGARDARLLIVATLRDTAQAQRDVTGRLLDDAPARQLAVGGLDRYETAVLTAELGGQELPAELVDELHARTGGNPLFLGELVAHLARPGELPVRIAAAVLGSVDGVGARAREVLDLAAVLDGDVAVAHLEQLLGTGPDTLTAIDGALASGALVDHAGGTLRFRHPLIREALYDALPTGRRVALHRRVAQMLEDTDDPRPAVLAHHFRQCASAATDRRALHYGRLAAEHANARYAHEEAARLYDACVPLAGDGSIELCRLWLGRGTARYAAADFAGARADFVAAAALAETLGATDELALAAIGVSGHYGYDWGTPDAQRLDVVRRACASVGDEASARRARLEIRHAEAVLFVDGAVAARPLAARALSTARQVRDPATLADTLVRYHYMGFRPGDLERRSAVSQRALQYAETARDVPLATVARLLVICDDLETGRVDAAAATLAAADRDAGALGDRYLQWYVHAIQAERLISAGRFTDGETLADEAVARGGGEHNQNAFVVHIAQIAWLRWLQGRAGEAVAALKAISAAAPAVPALAVATAWLAGAAGDLQTAGALLDRAAAIDFGERQADIDSIVAWALLADIAHATAAPEHAARLQQLLSPHADLFAVGFPATNFGSVERPLGLLAEACGAHDEAIDRFRRATERNDQAGLPVMTAMTQVDEARVRTVRRGRGDRRRAVVLANAAAVSAAAIGMHPLAKMAAQLSESV